MIDSQRFFTTPGPFTSPGPHARRLDALPSGIDGLRRVVQGLLLHVFWAEHYGPPLSDERRQEVQLRYARRQLDRILELDPRPLTEPRDPEKRLVGNCRDFSVLLTAMLRHQGVPARARCGFGRYFRPQRFEDHWVCEYWEEKAGRWILVDAQLDELQVEKLGIGFDPLDVPREQFLTGGRAWRMCRTGEADPEAFGIHDLRGLWFVRGDLVRDAAALNRMELLPWDGWGLIDAREEALSPDDWTLLDHLAELTEGDVPDFRSLRLIYESEERLRVPAVIRSYTAGGVETVRLEE
jgi:hypothetical protein